MKHCIKCGSVKIARMDINEKGIKYTAWYCNQCRKIYEENILVKK